MVNESYRHHFGFAVKVSVCLFLTSLAVFIHALIPAWFTKTGSGTIRKLYKELE